MGGGPGAAGARRSSSTAFDQLAAYVVVASWRTSNHALSPSPERVIRRWLPELSSQPAEKHGKGGTPDPVGRVVTSETASAATQREYIVSLIGALLGYALTLFIVLLIARLVLDWAGIVAGGPAWVSRARALTHAGTEPVIAPVRRVLRPVRAGGLSIDLAFTVVFVAALLLRSIAFNL